MKEIKFRMWNIIRKEFFYFNVMTIAGGSYYPSYWKDITGTVCDTTDTDRFDDEKMLYSGINDKNGQEIYEGDIIQISELVKDIVVFEYGQFKPRRCTDYEAYTYMKDSIVIGNKFKNPDILEWM